MSDTIPADFVFPSASRAAAIDKAVRGSFSKSVTWCLDQIGVDSRYVEHLGERAARPCDFGCYYDILVALNASNCPRTSVAHAAAKRFLSSPSIHGSKTDECLPRPSGLLITTLREPWYDHGEVDCLIRWLDLESENAMSLVSLNTPELNEATLKIQTALSSMEILLPEFLAEMLAITSEIIFAKPSTDQKFTFGGASSFSLWGGIALNANAHANWWQYLPRLVHEYSHNLLFGIAREEPLLLNDPEERYPSPLRHESRPLDGIFHAAFVSAREALAMREMLVGLRVNSGYPHYAFLLEYCTHTMINSEHSFKDCLSVIRHHGKLTELGRAILHDAERAICG
jgi:hypothetical protein